MHTTTTKQQLILSLLELGSERGLLAVSLSSLAKHNNISKAAIFHHFQSREALIAELFSYCNTLAYKQKRSISLEGSANEVLSRAMAHWHQLYEDEVMRSFYRIIESEALTHGEAASIKRTLDEMLIGQSSILLESLSNSGRLDIEDLDLAIQSFSSVVQRFLYRILLDDDPDIEWEEERFINRFCSLYSK
ncbi:TetR/AcrR family transcriptional regulator [uncultured Sphaerochaeta sp.]|uniref:TetR/AcrR family transcriptional regulator n=1 Tax=uncultured Sphaerochaeta sp. TaxID=886478 RepID=UPI002AA63531|nr:TetR/AcrR family transcriptional regulator [uncultured Sphaerochaeta sp.]